ncbi:barstar family protein [Paenimaribius caenipelagi]|uniref:Barstar family protein n=1 Tax=Palleronia caenipelagi TaxID=2489174 RepID=A0A547PJN7_9RHOB|nr:barstar family protein [Palleronia caenipelagi]
MRTLKVDVADCLTADDVYERLLAALHAPDWHGHNLDALWDSITSDINGLAPPYSIAVKGHEQAPAVVSVLLSRIQTVFADALRGKKIHVELRLV